MFVTFEGCEASGKSTQAKLLKTYIESLGYEVVYTKEPGGTVLADKMRGILLSNEVEDPLTEFLLLSAGRRDHSIKIVDDLRNGKFVISDRFADSSVVYQGYAKGLDLDVVYEINRLVTTIEGKILKPDITFLMDIEVDDLPQRVAKSSAHTNFYDTKDFSFHQKVRDGFLKLASTNKDRIVVIDGHKTVLEIQDKIRKIVSKNLSHKR